MQRRSIAFGLHFSARRAAVGCWCAQLSSRADWTLARTRWTKATMRRGACTVRALCTPLRRPTLPSLPPLSRTLTRAGFPGAFLHSGFVRECVWVDDHSVSTHHDTWRDRGTGSAMMRDGFAAPFGCDRIIRQLAFAGLPKARRNLLARARPEGLQSRIEGERSARQRLPRRPHSPALTNRAPLHFGGPRKFGAFETAWPSAKAAILQAPKTWHVVQRLAPPPPWPLANRRRTL